MFGTEEEETHELCREVIAELMQRPAERFYAGEYTLLQAAALGFYALDQLVLEWLLDVRRLTDGDRPLEGNSDWDARGGTERWPGHFNCIRREIVSPSHMLRMI
jgi:hypothetical protein